MKQIKDLSLREFYSFLADKIKVTESLCADLGVPLESDPAKYLRDDITVEKYLECYGDDDAELLSVEK